MTAVITVAAAAEMTAVAIAAETESAAMDPMSMGIPISGRTGTGATVAAVATFAAVAAVVVVVAVAVLAAVAVVAAVATVAAAAEMTAVVIAAETDSAAIDPKSKGISAMSVYLMFVEGTRHRLNQILRGRAQHLQERGIDRTNKQIPTKPPYPSVIRHIAALISLRREEGHYTFYPIVANIVVNTEKKGYIQCRTQHNYNGDKHRALVFFYACHNRMLLQ